MRVCVRVLRLRRARLRARTSLTATVTTATSSAAATGTAMAGSAVASAARREGGGERRQSLQRRHTEASRCSGAQGEAAVDGDRRRCRRRKWLDPRATACSSSNARSRKKRETSAGLPGSSEGQMDVDSREDNGGRQRCAQTEREESGERALGERRKWRRATRRDGSGRPLSPPLTCSDAVARGERCRARAGRGEDDTEAGVVGGGHGGLAGPRQVNR